MSIEVVWRGALFGVAGYADEARDFVLGLDELGVDVQAVDVPLGPHPARLERHVEQRLRELQSTRVGRSATVVHHSFPPRWGPNPQVGRTMFETDRIPTDWVERCNAVREIWVPSQFNVETFAASGVEAERLHVVPFPIRLADWDPDGDRIELPPHGFSFLAVFDWSRRKGWDVLLRAYCSEFSRHDDVALVLRIHSSYGLDGRDLRDAIRQFVTGELGVDSRHAPALVVIDRIFGRAEMAALYRAADCFVLPSRGEGWGKPYAEALATGLPVIATRWSGQTEFLNDANAYLVDVEGLVPVSDEAVREAPHFRGHRWAEPSVEHLRQLMRRVYEDRDAARARARQARPTIEAYDAAVVCAGVLARLAALVP